MSKSFVTAIALLCVIGSLALPVPAMAQGEDSASVPASSPSDIPEARQFDFWIGEWTGHSYYIDANRDTISYTVHNSITSELDGCVIMENFTGGPVAGLNGISVSTFDRYTNQWRQTWVDNQRGYLDFEGGFSDGVMDLRRSFTRNDSTVTQRMRWLDIERDRFTWFWERSNDDGHSWTLLWEIRYKRSDQ